MLSAPGITVRKRVAILFYIVLLAFTGLAGRLAFIQFVRGEELRGQAIDARMRDIPVEARRGVIYDSKGRELAISISVESAFAFPAQITEPAETALRVADVLGLDPADTLKKITQPSSFVWLKRKMSEDEAKRLKALKIEGIEFTQEAKRFYPKENLASHVLGIAGIDSQGLEGIEARYDRELRGTSGRIIVEFDAWGRELPGAMHKYVPPIEGNSLFLYIDEVVQFIAERELEKLMVETQAKAGAIVMMDPKTGGILAMANRPDFDPNQYLDYPSEDRRNFSVNDSFPPGSTFKPITAAAGLDEGTVKMTDGFFCNGSLKVGDRIVRCSSDHGSQTFEEVIENSCNVGFMQVGLKMGATVFDKYLRDFGFGSTTGIDLPGEAEGITIPVQRVKPIDLANMAFGQTLTVTPIQLLSAISAIANDGLLMTPQVVREIRSADGALVREIPPEPKRQVVSRQTAQELRSAMEHVIEEGTGQSAQVEGYRLGGKTGTAQKVIDGRFVSGKYISSFVGFGPAEDPKVAMLVIIDEPQGDYYGGVIAAPVFSAAMTDVLRYLQVPRAKPEVEVSRSGPSHIVEEPVTILTPDVLNMTPGSALKALNQIGLRCGDAGGMANEGSVVIEQTPAPGEETTKGSSVALVFGDAELMTVGGNMVVVPCLIGMTMREVADTLSDFGFNLAAVGSGFAVQQNPEPGWQCTPGSVITVKFSQTNTE